MKVFTQVFLLGVLSSSQSFAASMPQVAICHFDEQMQSWQLMVMAERSVSLHLEEHDDGLPGGTTAQSGTRLSSHCEPVGYEYGVE